MTITVFGIGYFCLLMISCMNSGLRGNGGSQDASEVKLVGGTPADEDSFRSVFIWTPSGVSLSASYCTGTKVADRFILTAAHCVLEQSAFPEARYLGPWHQVASLQPGKKLIYSFERKILPTTSIAKIKIKAIFLHPNVKSCLGTQNTEDKFCTWRTPMPDVAVIEVEPTAGSPFALAESAKVDFGEVLPESSTILMGYGAQADVSSKPPTLKFAEMTVATPEAVDAALNGTDADVEGRPDFAHSFGTIGYLLDHQNANLGSGDSGGPVMLMDRRTVVGINSDGYCPLTKPDCQRSTNSIFARIDTNSGYNVGQWLATVLPAGH